MLANLGYETHTTQATEEGAVAAVERITRVGPIPHVFMSGLGPLMAGPGDVLLTKPFREVDLIRATARAHQRHRRD
jgi:hypothetical protein